MFWQDFVIGLSVLLRGSETEKLRWAFNLYDINKDGYITREVWKTRVNRLHIVSLVQICVCYCYCSFCRRCRLSWSPSMTWWAGTPLLVSKMMLHLNTWRISSRYRTFSSPLGSYFSQQWSVICLTKLSKHLCFTENGPEQRRSCNHWWVHRDLSEGRPGLKGFIS